MGNQVQIEFLARNEKLLAVSRKSEAAVKTFGDRALSVFKRVNAAITASYNKLGVLAPLGVGVGFTMMAKDVIEFDNALRKLGRTGGYAKQDVQALRSQIMGLTKELPVTKDEFAAMANELNATGIPLATIKNILPALGKGFKAAEVDGALYAATMGELLDKYKVAAADLPALQDQVSAALKFEDVRGKPEEFLKSLQGLSKTMQLMKSEGLGNATPLMALMAQLTSFTGSSGEAAGSIDSLFNGLLKLSKNKDIKDQLAGRGISFFNADGSIKNIGELLPQIKRFGEELKKSGKSAEEGVMALGFRPEAAKAVITLMAKYDEVMKKQEDLGRAAGSMGKDYADVQESMSAKLVRFQNQVDNFKVTHMSAALAQLSKVLDVVNAHPIITKGILSSAGLVAAAVGINKMVGAFKGLKDVWGPIDAAMMKTTIGKYLWVIAKGAAIGTAIGTAINAGIDKLGGEKGYLGSKAFDADHRGEREKNQAVDAALATVHELNKAGKHAEARELLNKIQLVVNIDKSGRVTTDSNDVNTSIDLNRGEFALP